MSNPTSSSSSEQFVGLESKLIELKRLHNDGLLSELQHKEAVQGILISSGILPPPSTSTSQFRQTSSPSGTNKLINPKPLVNQFSIPRSKSLLQFSDDSEGTVLMSNYSSFSPKASNKTEVDSPLESIPKPSSNNDLRPVEILLHNLSHSDLVLSINNIQQSLQQGLVIARPKFSYFRQISELILKSLVHNTDTSTTNSEESVIDEDNDLNVLNGLILPNSTNSSSKSSIKIAMQHQYSRGLNMLKGNNVFCL
jgi:hypothetical protein